MNFAPKTALVLVCLSVHVGCAEPPTAAGLPGIDMSPEENATVTSDEATSSDPQPEVQTEAIATLGAGCFWCVEAVFQEVDGVISVTSGYEGGSLKDPTYEQVCSGLTGHAEVCRLTFDPRKVKFKQLLEVFWKTHDPTTLNRQGNDVGTQYRSVVFYHTEEQKKIAEEYKKKLDESGAFPNPIVTEISPTTRFYKAEEYHQNYYRSNPSQGYCQFVIRPKMEKFRAVFQDQLKEEK